MLFSAFLLSSGVCLLLLGLVYWCVYMHANVWREEENFPNELISCTRYQHEEVLWCGWWFTERGAGGAYKTTRFMLAIS